MKRILQLVLVALAASCGRASAGGPAALPAPVRKLPAHTRAFVYFKQGPRLPALRRAWEQFLLSLPAGPRSSADRLADDLETPAFFAVLETGYRCFDHIVVLAAAEVPNARERWGELRAGWSPFLKLFDVRLPASLDGAAAVKRKGRKVGFLNASGDWLYFSNVEAAARAAAVGALGEGGGLKSNAFARRLLTHVDPNAEILAFVDLEPVWQFCEYGGFPPSFSPHRAGTAGTAPPDRPLAHAFMPCLGLRELSALMLSGNLSRLRVALAAQSGYRGVPHYLFPPASVSRLSLRAPKDYPFVARLAMDSADDFAHAYRDILGRLAPDISAEFDRELRDVAAQCGVDVRKQILTNLRDECVLALRFQRAANRRRVRMVAMLLMRVGDRRALQAAVEKLLSRLKKPATRRTRGGAVVYERNLGLLFRAIGISDEMCVLGPSASEVWKALEARPPNPAPALLALTREKTSAALFVRSVSLALAARAGIAPPRGKKLTDSLVVRAARRGRVIVMDVQTPSDFVSLLSSSKRVSGWRRKEQVCMTNLKKLGIACFMFASDYDEKLPVSLDQLAPYMDKKSMLRCPVTGRPYKLLKPGAKMTAPNPSVIPILQDAQPHPDGRVGVLFMDGHVQLQRAKE